MAKLNIWRVLNDPRNIIMHIKHGDTFKANAVIEAINQYEREINHLQAKLDEANERIKHLNRQLISEK